MVGADAGLAPERPADVGRDDADVVLGETEGVGEQVARVVGVLRGDPGGHAPVTVTVSGGLDQDGVALDRRDRDALVDHPHPDDVVGCPERVGTVLVAAADGNIGAEVLELQGSAVCDRGLDVGHDREVVVVDVDQLDRVDRLGPGLGEDQGDGVADEAHLVEGQGATRALLVDVGERLERAAAQVLGGVDGQHAGSLLGLRGVDAQEGGVGERAAHEHRVHDGLAAAARAVRLPVVDEGALADEQLAVLDAANLRPQQRRTRSRHGAHPSDVAEEPSATATAPWPITVGAPL